MVLEYTLGQIPDVARQLLEKLPSRIVGIYGPMGSGKTTLIRALVAELHGEDSVSSPTFGIVNEYHYPDGRLLGYHFDFFRIENDLEALDIGFEEYLSEDVWIFMEWPERINRFLPATLSRITLEVLDPERRRLRLH